MHTLLFASFQICTDVTNYFPLATRGMGWGGATVLDFITHVLLRCGTLVMTCTCIRCYARKARWGFQVTARQMRAFFAKHDLKNMRFCKSSKAERYINLMRVILQDPDELSGLHIQSDGIIFQTLGS